MAQQLHFLITANRTSRFVFFSEENDPCQISAANRIRTIRDHRQRGLETICGQVLKRKSPTTSATKAAIRKTCKIKSKKTLGSTPKIKDSIAAFKLACCEENGR